MVPLSPSTVATQTYIREGPAVPRNSHSVVITNQTRATCVCDRATVADGFFLRLLGLLGRSPLEPGAGLLIRPSSGAHTFGVRIPIDVCESRAYG
jgi:hypothetical protein